MEFHSFDEPYLERLRAGDLRTHEHFGSYFGTLIKLKLRSRLQSKEAIEDVRQETFVRFYAALRDGKILHAERLGSFMNSVCNNVLLEHYRASARYGPVDQDAAKEEPRTGEVDIVTQLTARETEQKVRDILQQLPERDRRLLREIFLEERDKDEVCRDYGIDRDYLRVLLHRAKKSFKSSFLSSMEEGSAELNSA